MVMKEVKDIERAILLAMLIAPASNYAKSVSEGKSKDTFSAISSLLAEFAVRKATHENCYYKCRHGQYKQL